MSGDDQLKEIRVGKDPDVPTPQPPASPGDAILLAFLESIEAGEGRYGLDITLLIDGVYVSGIPISLAVYYAAMGEELARASERAGGNGEAWRESFTKLADESREILARPKDQRPPRYYVHLSNATVLLNGSIARVPTWRGRLASVSAWFLGSMGQG